ncbi:MAG: Rieske 2Fe-2S domain-containing protein [Pseudomonadales bacterium]|nr:Rieske 2Fe-2S domain-containing protein [Pseudomonadales bacterium]
MTNSAEETAIIETVLGFCETGETHMEDDLMLNPVIHYTDTDRYDREVEVLFRKFPIIVGHVSQLRAPGEYLTHDDTGVPILVTRNRSGVVKAFANVCRHRGARVVNEPCGKAATFSCPYHSWTYDLDGNLRGVPQEVGFPDLDKASRGLVELPAFERHGLIWVRPTVSETDIDIDSWLAPMAEQLGSLSMDTHVVYREWTIPTEMSWRLALEGFQESYHFCSAHKDTACSTYLDNQSVFLDQYPHIRHAVPLARISTLRDQSADSWDYRTNFMTQNYLFPCNFAQVMTDHVYIHTIIPTGPGRCVFKCMMLIPEEPVSEKTKRYWEANFNVVRTVFDEDFAIGANIQRGFAAGVNEHFVFGRFEAGLQLGQKAIEDALAGRLTV